MAGLRAAVERRRAESEALRERRDRAVEEHRRNPTTFDPYAALDAFKQRHGLKR